MEKENQLRNAGRLEASPKLRNAGRKVSIGNIIILVILLIIAGVVGSYFIKDVSIVGECETQSDCEIYAVSYIKGEGFVCSNDFVKTESSFQTKILMFKYASQKAALEAPSDCLCVENQCEIKK